MARIKKGDTVVVLGGKDRGKSGKVLQVWPVEDRALVERLNLAKHFDRPQGQNQPGGIIERERPIPLGKLAPLCAKCGKPARVGWQISDQGDKRRICHRCRDIV